MTQAAAGGSYRGGGGARRRVVPVVCNVLGTLLLIAVFALVVSVFGAWLLGYGVYDAAAEGTGGAGSAVFVRAAEPAEVQVDELVAYAHDGAVVVSRVVENRVDDGEVAVDVAASAVDPDASNDGDPSPTDGTVPYSALLGTVALSVPHLGALVTLCATAVGKLYLAMTFACGAMLNVLADRMRRASEQTSAAHAASLNNSREHERTSAAHAATLTSDRPRTSWLRTAVMALLAVVFLGSAGVVGYVRYQRHLAYETYQTASSAYVRDAPSAEAAAPQPPIQVDFAALTSTNPDVIGWLYCPGTNINYPVLHGPTNDTYLRHDYTGTYNINGSIFTDAANRPGFVDANTIVYGHHMADGVMFEPLEDWSDQAFYEAHPIMWLLTPEQDYQVVLVSGHHISAHSDMYEMLHEHDDAFARYLAEAVALSDFTPLPGAEADGQSNYVMLTTCAYVYEDARYVLHGKLVPVG